MNIQTPCPLKYLPFIGVVQQDHATGSCNRIMQQDHAERFPPTCEVHQAPQVFFTGQPLDLGPGQDPVLFQVHEEYEGLGILFAGIGKGPPSQGWQGRDRGQKLPGNGLSSTDLLLSPG